ncbi:MAG: glutathione S-transferase [Hyphomicrobiaceae bacterium]
MAEYTVYGMAQSGNAYKVALMLQLAGADWAPRFVDFFNGETRTPEFRANVNEMGEVPVLEHKGLKLSQSGIILDYLTGELQRFGWRSEAERREVWRWILWDNHKLTSYTGSYRYFKCFAPELAVPEVQSFLFARMKAAYRILDTHLEGREFVAADRPTIADLSICGYLFFEDEIGISFESDNPHLAAWLKRIKALPGWKHPYDILPGHPLPPRKA